MKEETSKKTTVKEETSIVDDPIDNISAGKPVSLGRAILSVWLSRKLWMTLISFGLVWACHEITINHLYAMTEPHQAGALTTIYVSTLSVLGVIIAAYLGTNALQSKFGISGAAQLISESITQKSDETRNENINIKEEKTIRTIEEVTKNINLEEHIVEEGVNNDGYARPFTQIKGE